MKSEKEEFMMLRANGKSFDFIAKELNRSKGTLLSWNKELKEGIARLEAIRLESMYERYFLSHQGKVKLYGELFLKIKKELNKRELEGVSTEKLLELLVKFHGLLKDEYIKPVFLTDKEIETIKRSEDFFEELMDGIKL